MARVLWHVACDRNWTREVLILVFREILVVCYMSSVEDSPAEHRPVQYSAGWTVRWGKAQSLTIILLSALQKCFVGVLHLRAPWS